MTNEGCVKVSCTHPPCEATAKFYDRTQGHGRKETRVVQVLTVTDPGVDFPHAAQVAKTVVTAPTPRPASKVGRDEQINLPAEGAAALTRLGHIADRLMLRTGGCSGCALSGTCRVCRPLAKLYQEAKAPLNMYCQHAPREATA